MLQQHPPDRTILTKITDPEIERSKNKDGTLEEAGRGSVVTKAMAIKRFGGGPHGICIEEIQSRKQRWSEIKEIRKGEKEEEEEEDLVRVDVFKRGRSFVIVEGMGPKVRVRFVGYNVILCPFGFSGRGKSSNG